MVRLIFLLMLVKEEEIDFLMNDSFVN